MSDLAGRKALVEAGTQAGLDANEVRRIPWASNAPESMDDCQGFLGNLLRLISAADNVWPAVLDDYGIAAWPALLVGLQEEAKNLNFSHIRKEARYIAEKGTNSGSRQRNALYIPMLALPEGNSNYARQCELLMMHVFLAHLKILQIPEGTKLRGGLVKGDTSLEAYEAYSDRAPWPALTVQPKNAGLALRGLFSGEPWAHAMMDKFPAFLAPLEFARSGGFSIDDSLLSYGKSQGWLEDVHDYIFYYVAQAYGVRPRHKVRGKKESISPKPEHPKKAAPPQKPPTLPPGDSNDAGEKSGDGTDPGQDSRKSREFCLRHDVCPGEDDPLNDVDPEGDSEQTDSAADEGDKPKTKAEGKRKRKHTEKQGSRKGNPNGGNTDQAIRASKFFAFSNDRLSPFELAVIDVDARRRVLAVPAILETSSLHEPHQSGSDVILLEEAELLIFALVMLWTGSGLDRTTKLRISFSPITDESLALLVTFDPNSNGAGAIIRILVTFLADAPRYAPFPPQDRNRTDQAHLKDAAGLGPLLWRFHQIVHGRAPVVGDVGSRCLFTGSPEFYEERIPDLLSRLDRTGRLTPSMLSSSLFAALMSWTGKDASAATMITGDTSGVGRVQMFYAVRRMDHLEGIYSGTVSLTRNLINLSILPYDKHAQAAAYMPLVSDLVRGTTIQTPFRPESKDTLYLGINICPTDGAMQQMVQDLINELQRPRNLHKEGEWIGVFQPFHLLHSVDVWHCYRRAPNHLPLPELG